VADKKFGILITATENVSEAVKKIASVSAGAGTAVSKMASVGAAGFKLLGSAAGVVAALPKHFFFFVEAIKKLSEIWRMFSGEFEHFGEFVKQLILPVLQTFRDVLQNAVLTPMEKWMDANRAIIRMNLAAAFGAIAKVLVSAVAVSADAASQAFFRLKIAGLQVLGFFSGENNEKIIQSARASMNAFSTLVSDTEQRVADAISSGQEMIEKGSGRSITVVTETMKKAAEDRVKANKEAQEKIRASNELAQANTIANTNLKYDLEKRASDGLAEIQISNLERVAEVETAVNEQRAMGIKDVTQLLASSFSSAFLSVVEGTASVGEAILGMLSMISKAIFTQAIAFIFTEAAKGGAGWLASGAAAGPIGLAIAAASFAGVIAAIMGQVSKVPEPETFAMGGFVPGSGRGDKVHALLEPGEFVMSRRDVSSMRSFMSNFRGGTHIRDGVQVFQDGGFVQPMDQRLGGGGTQQLNIQVQQLPNRNDTRRWIRATLLPELRAVQAGGF